MRNYIPVISIPHITPAVTFYEYFNTPPNKKTYIKLAPIHSTASRNKIKRQGHLTLPLPAAG